jgi:uncharacterized repeat protein (TIGR01451 family)
MCCRFVFFIAALFLSQAGSAQLFGEHQNISTNGFVSRFVVAADLDGDGDMDILVAESIRIAWYENLGGGNFGPRQTIGLATSARCVQAADLDGDGNIDALAADEGSSEIIWYKNLGGGIFSAEQIISTLAHAPRCVFSADLDTDGDLDVLSGSLADGKVAWYENLGEGSFGIQQIISTGELNQPRTVFAEDLDGDGDMDVLSAGFNDDKIVWYENTGGGLFGTQVIISTLSDAPSYIHSSDLDGDGDADVLSCAFHIPKVACYKNLGGGLIGAEQVLSTLPGMNLVDVKSADIDNDGDLDVLSGSTSFGIYWYENLGTGQFGLRQTISTIVEGVWSFYPADMDGDGDIDVIYASAEDEQIAWHENLLSDGCMDSGACNYDPEVWIEDGSCCYDNCGCTDPIASNYLPTATCDNGTCIILEGCTNELSTNYDPEAVVSNGTCEYSIIGTVFFDENGNGVMDGNEYVLPNQTVLMNQTGQSHITNDEGIFIAHSFQQQITSFEMVHSSSFPYSTNANPMIFNPINSTTAQLMFGVSNTMPIYDVAISQYPTSSNFFCESISNYIIMFKNMGNWLIDGVVEFEYDTLFQGYQELTPIDSVNGNSVYMSFQNLLPGETRAYFINLLSPSVDYIGETVNTTAYVYGYFEGELAAYGEHEFPLEITCAYDPNDKQAFPIGYTDQHLLLQETEQEFLIRFQNTGNAPAQNIRIQDTLDVNFDIESFRLIANSHSVMTTINPETRLIDFYFENIQLPDSVNNEPASHGLISYKITPLPNLPVGTVLENTAYIYFDNNDPIITNTTWTTIHECGGEANFIVESIMTCEGLSTTFTSQYPQIENYHWTLDGVTISTESTFEATFPELGDYTVLLEASNPLCTDINTTIVSVENLAEVNSCPGDFNCDGYRGVSDLNTLLTGFGCNSDCEIDVNNDGVTTVMDFIVFLSVFGVNCYE